ncbi:unnamed protein product, partial [marine sediment metagenome]
RIIEVAPLAYMRGRTNNDSFIVLDEAQNTSPEQMKMFLTRLGFGSKAVITGDITQIDLPSKSQSGLFVVQKILSEIENIKFSLFIIFKLILKSFSSSPGNPTIKSVVIAIFGILNLILFIFS